MPPLPPIRTEMSPESLSQWLRDLAQLTIASVHPDNLFAEQLPAPGRKTLVVGAGKASAAMAAALERAWYQQYPQADISGVVVTRYGHAAQCEKIEVLEAAHPMPDNLGEQAAKRMLASVEALGEEDLVLALVSGGGSALMSLPAPGLTLQQKQSINKALLRSGAPICEINTVRRHLSAIKGGRLAAAAHPARVVTYLISDVPGDDPTLIASGPTLPDNTTAADALEILLRYQINLEPEVRAHLEAATESPRPDDAGFARDQSVMLAKAADALEAARSAALAAGVEVRVLGDDLEGEARELGAEHAAMALDVQEELRQPLLILSSGETSVTVTGNGRGGRNVEYLLGLFDGLKGAPGIYGLAIDTDGIDGSEDNAGASFAPDDWAKMQSQGLQPTTYLANNDAYSFFAELGNLIVTGPTRTNVNDFRAILVLPAGDN
ncbi:glycerate kinase [Microbulbifer agarilyticus]|uniref:glycerate kinase type-2 family protein n=1 Tax=Microbulbifer agarilyticus TaxID=260552 RepID=UPI001C93ECA3|nr:glycerate kinase [Microbulbifer agarilyticus]MBY6190434.1 glycerate kinase [Microbulbifer agarilyticus]